MKIDVEIVEGLQRCVTVVLTEDSYKQAAIEQLQLFYKHINDKDILASKNFAQTLQQQLDAVDIEKIHNALMSKNLAEVAMKSAFKVAGSPVFKVTKTASNEGFSYQAIFEIYPTITLPDLDKYNFTQLVAEVTDEEIENTLLVLRRQQAKWCSIERPAQAGDSVIVNCYAKIGERVFDGKEMRVELVEDDMVEGFEKALIGVTVGEKLPVEINFSEDHYQTDVAGKSVMFDVEVLGVESLIVPELDEHFIKSSGVESGDKEVMRSVVRKNMEGHLQKIIRLKNTLAIFNEILKDNPVSLPTSLLNEELKRLTCDPCEEVEGVESFKHDIDPSMFTDLAHTRVARSLLVSEFARVKGVFLDENEVRARVEDLVEEYPQKEKIIEWFYGDEVNLSGVQSDVLGEQVADLILSEVQAEKITTSYTEMMSFSCG